ncbi:hypothetical protein IPH70_01105 [Candidatus Roizmanbacteria bacterium]|nr:MAG: hypothetical protein IPH70_01105 [Candidatus Roizmanbacteria bacterium]
MKWGAKQKNVLLSSKDINNPACGSFHQVLAAYGSIRLRLYKIASKIAFVYKNYPLEKFIRKGDLVAYAAEAKGMQ